MKTSAWIKLIGILCIFFGASGIVNAVVSIVSPEMIGLGKEKMQEVDPALFRLMLKLSYVPLITNGFYLMAGILFLLKKPFSLIIMYLALPISILGRIVPFFFFSQYTSNPFQNFEINIFSLLGPVIDLILLILVFRLAGYYYNENDVIVRLLSGKMSKFFTVKLLKFMTFIGLFCLSVPILIFGLWIYAWNTSVSQPEAVAIFNSYLPDFLAARYATAYLSLVFCLLAIILSSISMKLPGKFWKFNMIILIFSVLLLLLNLFQMM